MGTKPKFWYLRRRSVASDVDEELRLHLELRIEELIASGMRRGRGQARGAAPVRRHRSDPALLPSTGRNTGDGRATHLDVRGFHAGRANRHAQPDARPDADADDRRDGRRRHRRHRGDLQRHQRRDAEAAAVRAAGSPGAHLHRYAAIQVPASPPSTTWRSREQQTRFEQSATYTDRAVSFSNGEIAEVLRTRVVSWGFFSLLGMQPVIGRDFAETDGRPGTPPVVLASHAFWQQRLGGRADAIGHADPARRRGLHAGRRAAAGERPARPPLRSVPDPAVHAAGAQGPVLLLRDRATAGRRGS